MENVVLIIHLLLALGLIGIVLMQRSEGGGLGIGGGGGGGAVAGRSAATALGKITWILAAGFIVTSVALTIIAKQKADGASALDNVAPIEAPVDGNAPSVPGLGSDLLPPSSDDAAPLVPSSN